METAGNAVSDPWKTLMEFQVSLLKLQANTTLSIFIQQKANRFPCDKILRYGGLEVHIVPDSPPQKMEDNCVVEKSANASSGICSYCPPASVPHFSPLTQLLILLIFKPSWCTDNRLRPWVPASAKAIKLFLIRVNLWGSL
ncbi:hypothetical protein PAMP_011721 [Pampus punctatissimus]